ncbi:ABC transporter permease [Saccharospirillum salsuginis]|uniref:Transport permease protein n=1 Tax=Saccharospirillum salsuginis TaxID=418750 RepID=A0A918KGN1_9GAMM|nr:ABC transporter permease [Saccharospirillum salsuginis]GGX60172.1 teichoic acid translocation permease protein TagG [Saccharospirillum salsuginis]
MNSLQFISLVDTQARMALKAEASKLYLSYLWWVLEPILFVLVFYFVFEVLLNFGRENFLLFLMCGKIPFLWFSKSVNTGSNSIVQNKGLINQIDIPKTLFPYTSIQEALYKQWVVFLVLFAMVMFYGHWPSLSWLWLLPVILAEYLLILLCTLLGAYLVAFVGDFRMVIQMGTMFLMFSSGIFWDINSIGDGQLRELLMIYNPLAFLIDAYRQVLMENAMYDLQHLALLSAGLMAGILMVQIVYRVQSRTIAAKVVAG